MNQAICRLGIATSIALTCLATLSRATAQIVPDNTLPVNSTVTPGCTVCTINGGTIRGTNLFHSFSEFGVPTGGEAFFNNSLQIQNIFSRITGNSVSNIDGVLRVNGTANLFLLNPNGISFGANATLNLGGSFIASTASSLVFADGTVFSAAPDTSTPPLLTISVPLGLQFRGNQGKIVVQGNGRGTRITTDLTNLTDLTDWMDTDFGLQVLSNQTLAMVGGDMSLEGATLKTAGGRIELGSVAGSDFVSLTPIAKGWALGYQGVSAFGDIQLSQQATVDASGLGGGDIAVWGRHLSLSRGSQIEASTLGAQPGGTLAVHATNSVELMGTSADGGFPSALFASVYPGGKGTGGELSIDTGRLIARDGAQVSTGTFGEGQSGNLRVNATESVELVGTSSYGEFPSGLLASVYPGGKGAGGELSIDTGRLIVKDGAQVLTVTWGEGASGTLRVNATQSVELVGRSFDGRASSGLFTSVQPGGKGAGGELSIDTGRLIVRNGATVTTSTLGEGPSGNLRVSATESVEVTGRSPNGFPSLLAAQTRTAYNGGTLSVQTERLVVEDGAQITVSSTSSGRAGTLELKAESIVLNNQASLQANTTGGGGNISLSAPLLLLRRGSNITTNAQGNNIPGGNITIDTDNLVAVPKEDSNISANSQDFRGGDIKINASDIFGIQFRNAPTPLSDITATGKDSSLNGNVQIDIRDVNPSAGLAVLPTNLVDRTNQIDQSCSPGGANRENKFTVTGRGGLPQSPTGILYPDMVLDDLKTLTTWEEDRGTGGRSDAANSPTTRSAAYPQSPTPNPPRQLVEAQGWIISPNGKVILTATALDATPHTAWPTPPPCQVSQTASQP